MITLTITYIDGTKGRIEAYNFEYHGNILAVYDDVYARPAKTIIPLCNVKRIDREMTDSGDTGRVKAYTWKTCDDLALKNSTPPRPEIKKTN
jgi:hypothetical protein